MGQRAASGLSRAHDAADAGREAGEAAAAKLGRPGGTALVFASHHHAGRLARVLDAVRLASGAERVAGGIAYAVLTDEGEVEEAPGVAVLLLGPGALRLTATLDPDPAGADADDAGRGAALMSRLTRAEADARGYLLMPGPEVVWPEELLAGFAAPAGRPVLGAGLCGVDVEPVQVGAGEEVREGALLGVALAGPAQLAFGASRALVPVGMTHAVTSMAGDVIDELDGRPAQDALAAALGEERWGEVQRGARAAYLGVPDDPESLELGYDAFTARGMLQLEPGGGLIAPVPLAEGQRIGFVLKDPAAARAHLSDMLERMARGPIGRRPVFGLYFNCTARGRSLYGEDGVDVALWRARFPGLPIAGLCGAYELCPAGGANRWFAYTGVALLVGEG